MKYIRWIDRRCLSGGLQMSIKVFWPLCVKVIVEVPPGCGNDSDAAFIKSLHHE